MRTVRRRDISPLKGGEWDALIGWPALAGDATSDQIKAWYVDMAATARARIDILRERVDALDTLLEAYRAPP